FEGKLDCTAKFRYRQADKEVILSWINDTDLLVEYKNPVSSVTPGQEAVFYQGEVCLGGGVIEEVYKNGEKVTYIE
ncbi:MAG: tRNA 2-thiouridine(34) synthase MnmA, partial [Erysipelotrichales bacterium]|nr:tRNA 2-thiouridine(34) synthase MnmA [Erysipelotrichales bacterium]